MSNETKHPDYTFTDDNAHKERSVIQINEGDYEGMKFVFGGIKFVALEGDEENMGLNFTYDILENPNETEPDSDLVGVLGDILVNILETELEEVDGEFLKGS